MQSAAWAHDHQDQPDRGGQHRPDQREGHPPQGRGQIGSEQRQREHACDRQQERCLGERGENKGAVTMAEPVPEELPADEVKTVARQVFRDLGAAVQGMVMPTPRGRGGGPQELPPGLGKQEAGKTVGKRARGDRTHELGAARRREGPGCTPPETVPQEAERQRENEPAAEARERTNRWQWRPRLTDGGRAPWSRGGGCGPHAPPGGSRAGQESRAPTSAGDGRACCRGQPSSDRAPRSARARAARGAR